MGENEKNYIEENATRLDMGVEGDNVQVEAAPEDIATQAVEVALSQVSETDVIDIEIDEAFPYTSNNDLTNHAILNNRDAENAHPIEAISGLRDELDYIRSVKRVYSAENGLAEFYAWADGNNSWENRSGYFVKLVYDTETGVEHVAICTNKDDVYGVVVQSSGFVGNQIGADHGDDPAYAMVGIVGALRVRTDGTAQIGDYVVPSAAGIATKSEHNCGYRVVSHGSYPSYSYVTIAVTPQNDKINKIYGMLMESDGSIGNISIRIDDMESKIESANNNINVAIGNTEELKDLLEGSMVEIDRINQTINDTNNIVQDALITVEQTIQSANDAKSAAQAAAQDARKVVADLAGMSELADSMEDIVGYAYEDENGNVYSGAAGLIKLANETHVDYGILAEQVTEQGDDLAGMIIAVDKKHGATIQHLVSHIDKYAVGELSLSYGLTQEEAKSILTNDYIYVPTSTHEEELGSFERGYAYIWNPTTAEWVKGDEVSTATTYSDGANVGDLWYCFQDVEGPDDEYYIAETLYRWFGGKWIAVASMRDNYRGRMFTSIMQNADSIEQSVVALDGRLTLTEQDVDSISTTVADNKGNISNVTQRVDGIDASISNINGTLSATQQRVSDNEASIQQINYGAFHVVHQSFATAAPAPLGTTYSLPPSWDEASGKFVFAIASEDPDGKYYFHSENQTKYVKVLDDGGYEVYTIGNLAMSAIDSRISDTEASITETNQLVTKNSEAITSVSSKADENSASITQLTTYVNEENGKQNETMAAIQQQADANGASIGLVVKDGAVDGGVLVQAINGQTAAQISANSIVFSTGVTNSDGSFYMRLSGDSAEIRNGDFSIVNPYYRILLNPNDGIRVQKNTNIINGVVNGGKPTWTDMFYTESDTGNTYAGGWLLSEGSLSSGTGGTYVNFNSDPEETYTLWAGAEDASTAKFSVKKDGTLYATGATISGNITMIGGSISWADIDESGSSAYGLASSASSTASSASEKADNAQSAADSASLDANAANALATAIMNGECSGTFINKYSLYSPSIVGGLFRTAGSSEYTYSAMQTDGFYIYHESTITSEEDLLDQIPKMKLSVNNTDGNTIRIEVGAGNNTGGDNGKLILEKTVVDGNECAKLFYTVDGTQYGFQFDSTGVTMLGGGIFNVGEAGYAVFG